MLTAATSRAVFERYLTPAEEKQLLGHVAQFADVLARRDHAWMRLLRQTGLRVQSLSLLDVGAAREALATKRLRIDDAIAKGGRGYDVHLNKRAVIALKELLQIRRRMLGGSCGAGEESLLLCRRGHRLSVRSLQARMREWVHDCRLPVAASPHWWRHTLAKRLIANSESQDPLGIVQVALGQRSRNSTGVYSLPDREAIAMAMEAAA